MTAHYPKPKILAKIPRSAHSLLAASAGTGKTFTIENIVIDLVLEGVSLDEILVLTFTERALPNFENKSGARSKQFL